MHRGRVRLGRGAAVGPRRALHSRARSSGPVATACFTTPHGRVLHARSARGARMPRGMRTGPRHAVRNKVGKIKLANLYEGGNAGGPKRTNARDRDAPAARAGRCDRCRIVRRGRFSDSRDAKVSRNAVPRLRGPMVKSASTKALAPWMAEFVGAHSAPQGDRMRGPCAARAGHAVRQPRARGRVASERAWSAAAAGTCFAQGIRAGDPRPRRWPPTDAATFAGCAAADYARSSPTSASCPSRLASSNRP